MEKQKAITSAELRRNEFLNGTFWVTRSSKKTPDAEIERINARAKGDADE